MSKEISLFSGYNQRENRTTNYCVLVLRMLYEESPKLLADVLSSLISESLGKYIGIKFGQQSKRGSAVPDGIIRQDAFNLYLETKNYDWFYDDQLERQLEALDSEAQGTKVLIALGNFESTPPGRFSKIEALCREKYQNRIYFRAVSFEDFVQAAENLKHLPKNLADSIADFRNYLDEQNLLPSWQHWLDVVNCAGLPEDVTAHNVYMCPARGGPYSHWRCKYFGMYRAKRVEKVAEIQAVIDLLGPEEHEMKWKNITAPDEDFVRRARQKHGQLRPSESPIRVFLLGDLYETDFRKDTPRGMMGSKIYFHVRNLNPRDCADLAQKLKGKSWPTAESGDMLSLG